MMFDTLNIPDLGRLEIVETYEYYDQPVLFSCKNAAGQLYLVVAADETDQYETWLYAGVSAERLHLIRSGAIDLHDAFAGSEDGCLFQVRFSYNTPASPQIESIEANQLPEDMLPIRGECLDLETETSPVLSKPEPMPKNSENLELILLDKCTIQSLTNEELEIVSGHKTLVPGILLIENLKREETISKLSKLENTYWIDHWSRLAISDLLGQEIEMNQADVTEMIEDSTELKKHVKLAKKTAKAYDEWPKKLMKGSLDLSSKGSKNWIVEGVKDQLRTYPLDREITDDEIIRIVDNLWKETKNILTIPHSDWEAISRSVINDLDNKRIKEEHRHLKENERTYICNMAWLDFACQYFQTTQSEKSKIFNRWVEKFHQNLKYFAPYAYYLLALEFTISWHIRKSKGNYKREIMRDLEYLYYAHYTNVTFHTCDRRLKDTIHKIPFLKHMQEKMVYFYNDEEQRPGELNKSDWLEMLKYTG